MRRIPPSNPKLHWLSSRGTLSRSLIVPSANHPSVLIALLPITIETVSIKAKSKSSSLASRCYYVSFGEDVPEKETTACPLCANRNDIVIQSTKPPDWFLFSRDDYPLIFYSQIASTSLRLYASRTCGRPRSLKRHGHIVSPCFSGFVSERYSCSKDLVPVCPNCLDNNK